MVKNKPASPYQLRGLCFPMPGPREPQCLAPSSSPGEWWETLLQEAPDAHGAPCPRWCIREGCQERRKLLHFVSLRYVIGSGCAWALKATEARLCFSVLCFSHHFWCGEGLRSPGSIPFGACQSFNTVWGESKKISREQLDLTGSRS